MAINWRFRQGQGPTGQASPQPGGMIDPPSVVIPGIAINANRFPGAWSAGIPNVPAQGWLDLMNGFQPLPQTLEQQMLQSSKTRYRMFSRHTFEQARLPDPGAPAWAFTSLGLEEYSPIGTGIPNKGELRKLQGAPYFPNQMVPIQGLGGVVQGQMILQPLVLDPLSTADLVASSL